MTALLLMTLSAPPLEAEPIDDLKRDTKALELFLQDKEDKQKYCPKLKWKQTRIEVYKEALKSQLPKECKKK